MFKPNHKSPPSEPQSLRPDPNENDIISTGTEYFRIHKAATFLKCDAEDILHLGAMGKAEIMAPILSPEPFDWPFNSANFAFPEIDYPFRVTFSTQERVILSSSDLSKIEAVGWTIPHTIYAPTRARDLIKDALLLQSKEDANHTANELRNFFLPISNSSNISEIELDKKIKLFREAALYSPWYATWTIAQNFNDPEEVIKYQKPIPSPETITKINHLFVSKSELQRLLDDLPQDEISAQRGKQENKIAVPKNINHIERHASRRERMWKSAILLLWKMSKSKIDIDELVTKIEIEIREHWPEDELNLTSQGMKKQIKDLISGKVRSEPSLK